MPKTGIGTVHPTFGPSFGFIPTQGEKPFKRTFGETPSSRNYGISVQSYGIAVQPTWDTGAKIWDNGDWLCSDDVREQALTNGDERD